MSVTMALSALLMAQVSASATLSHSGEAQVTEVAFEQLAQGKSDKAIMQIKALLEANPGDPALLINLGAAYAELGDMANAEECYRQAISSDDRYNLELADGSWMDSRRAARIAMGQLKSTVLALR